MGLVSWLFRSRQRRAIFRFRLNGRWVYRDPVEIRRALAAANERWSELVDLVVQSSRPLPSNLNAPPELTAQRAKGAEAATKELADLVVKAFGVPTLQPDGTGLTEPERLDLLASYLLYCSQVMRATRPL